MTQARLDELTQALTRFNTSKENPRAATTAKKAQTASCDSSLLGSAYKDFVKTCHETST